MSLKIAIADDSPAIRSAIRSFIESNTEWQVCGEARDGQAALFVVQRHKPDFLVLDLSMPVMNGLEAARKIAVISPKTRIVLFTGHARDQGPHLRAMFVQLCWRPRFQLLPVATIGVLRVGCPCWV